jgi:mRNA-degrading endonuclease RelE of RelBE toxin-antitoxin system
MFQESLSYRDVLSDKWERVHRQPEVCEISIDYPCVERRTLHCVNCHNHFKTVRPSIKAGVISKHFTRDLKNEETVASMIKDILDCANLEFSELHKFEANIDGNLIFRARKEGMHIVYAVDKNTRIVFLRAFRNFSEYKRFLDDKKAIKKMLARSESAFTVLDFMRSNALNTLKLEYDRS